MKYRLTLLLVCNAALLPTVFAQPVQQPTAKQDRVDVFGDALPEHAQARLGSVRFHHEGGLIAAAFAPDGKTLVAAGMDKNQGLALRFWETGNGKEINRFTVKGTDLTKMAFAPDGKTVFLGRNAVVEQYDCQSGKLLKALGHRSVNFAVSPDGKWLAAISQSVETAYSPIVHIVDIATGTERTPFKGQRGIFVKCQWSADGKRLMSARGGITIQSGKAQEVIKGSICVWDAVTGKKLHEIDNDTYNLVFAPDGQTVAFQSQSGETRIVNIETGKTTCAFTVSRSYLEFTSDSTQLVTVNFDGGAPPCMWDATTGKQLLLFENQASYSERHRLVGFSPDGKMLAAMSGRWNLDGSVVLWNVATGKTIHHDGGHSNAVTTVAFAPSGRVVASGSADCTVRLWDCLTGKPLAKLGSHKAAITALAFAGDGKTLASSSRDGQIRLWDLPGRREVANLDGPDHGAASLNFSQDGKTLLVGGKAPTLEVWDLTALKKTTSDVTGVDGTVYAISRDGKLALSANGEERDDLSREKIDLWKLPAAKRLLSVDLRGEPRNYDHLVCWTAALSADGQLFAASHSRASLTLRGTMYADDTLRVFERATGQEWLKLRGVKVHALAFSLDGRFLAAGHGNTLTFHNHGIDSRVTVWDLASGDKLREWNGHANEVTCVAFSPDGKLVASGSADHTILIWKNARVAPLKGVAEQAPAEQWKTWWEDLGSKLPAGQAALAKLLARPREAVRWIAGEVKPVAPSSTDAQRIAKLIESLDGTSYKVRQEATAALEALGNITEPQLQKVLAGNPTLESRQRIEQLLAKLENVAFTPDRLRTVRALRILEWIGGTEARELLAALGRGAPESYITQLALAARDRMQAASR